VTKHFVTLPLGSKVGGALLVWFESVFDGKSAEFAAASKDVPIVVRSNNESVTRKGSAFDNVDHF